MFNWVCLPQKMSQNNKTLRQKTDTGKYTMTWSFRPTKKKEHS